MRPGDKSSAEYKIRILGKKELLKVVQKGEIPRQNKILSFVLDWESWMHWELGDDALMGTLFT